MYGNCFTIITPLRINIRLNININLDIPGIVYKHFPESVTSTKLSRVKPNHIWNDPRKITISNSDKIRYNKHKIHVCYV